MKFLRCKADAEDIVQETFVRWLNTEHAKIENTKAYLVRAVTNNCIKHLHAIKRKKEQYLAGINVGEWVDKFKETDLSAEFEARLGKAFHIIQHKLEPLERAVYVLKEAFGFDYKALQVVLDRKQDHCRQLFSRAKKKIATERARLSTVIEEQTALLKSFLQACDTGKAEPIIDELTRDLPAAVKK